MDGPWATFWLLLFTLGGIYSIFALFVKFANDPLRSYPGPLLWKYSRLPYTWYLFRCTLPWKIHQLHEQYGPIVRLAPNELSYITSEAWNDIYGRGEGRTQLRKDYSFAPGAINKGKRANSLFFEFDDEEHARLRRDVSHAFSSASLRAQEPIITKHINRLVSLMKSRIDQPINMTEMFNFVTFDIAGDVTFGDSFGCLEDATLHPWIDFIIDRIQGAALIGAIQKFGVFKFLFVPFIPKHLRAGDIKHASLTKERVDQCLAREVIHPDLVSFITRNFGKPEGISYLELIATSSNFIVGGAETTATLLTGLLYYLLANEELQFCLGNLTSQFRFRFNTAEDITMDYLAKNPLEDLDCCINETLRLFPPLPGNLRRIVPPEGKLICGKWVPGGTLVAVDVFSANVSSQNFVMPNYFIPERWLPTGDRKQDIFNTDKLDAVQAFSFGPRNCIGRNLAMMEIKLILIRLLWQFDFEFEEESKDWIDRVKACGFFIKPKLMVRCRDSNGGMAMNSEESDGEDTEEFLTPQIKSRNVRWFD